MIFILALLLRAPALGQSLWYDEIVTLFNYVLQPWSAIVKGQYSPNNHILFSLLAKLIVWGADRAEALERGRAALADFKIEGLKHNIPLHLKILANESFRRGEYDTGLLDRMQR